MHFDPPILELLKRWERQRRRGQVLSAAELCATQPDLLEEIQAHLQLLLPLSEKFDRWRQARRAGQKLSAAELCLDAPEMLPHLRHLIDGWYARHPEFRPTGDPEAPAPPPPRPRHAPRWLAGLAVCALAVGLLVAMQHFGSRPGLLPPPPPEAKEKPPSGIGELLCLRGHKGAVTSVTLSADGTLAVSGGADGTTRRWSLPSGRELSQGPSHTGPVLAVALAEGGRRALSASGEQVHCWDLDTTDLLLDVQLQGGRCEGVRFSPDGQRALAWGPGGGVSLWDLESGQLAHHFQPPGRLVTAAGFRPSGRAAALTGGARYRYSMTWDKESRQPSGHPAEAATVWIPRFEPIVDQAGTGAIGLTDLETAEELHRLALKEGVDQAEFTADNQRVLTVQAGRAQVWDVATGAEVAHWSERWPPWWRVVPAPDGRRVLAWQALALKPPPGELADTSAIDGIDGALFLFAADDPGCRRFDGHTGPITAVAFSRDGRQALTGGADGCVRLWQLPPPDVLLPGTRPFPAPVLRGPLPTTEVLPAPKSDPPVP